MKLLSKTNRYYFFFTAIPLLTGGVLFYYIISSIIKEEVSEVLQHELAEFLVNAEKDSSWLTFQKPIEFEISPTNVSGKPDIFSDTVIQDLDEPDELIPYMQLMVNRKIGDHYYCIILRESLIESEDILFGVSISIILLFIMLWAGLIMINHYLSKKIWKPFYENLALIKDYHLSQQNDMKIVNTDIQEFHELNQALIKMTNRLKKEYFSLKEFTENASHETQTPLAIIKSNIDLLLQQIKDEKQLTDLNKIETAANRISRTNQALLLLTKIENRQFTGIEKIELVNMVQECLENLEEFIHSKNLSVQFTKADISVTINANRMLVDILLNNLLSNAIRHNIKNGHINIQLDSNKMVIENSGKHISVDPTELFKRFVKADPSSQSAGLGLSIIKKVSEELKFDVEYHYENSIHRISILFPTL